MPQRMAHGAKPEPVDGMIVTGLYRDVIEAGFGPPLTHCDGDTISYSDQLELHLDGALYRVRETERGMTLEEYCAVADRDEALAVFIAQLCSRSTFLVQFAHEEPLERLRGYLAEHGIITWPNHVLGLADVPPVYRLFVPVTDWRRARSLLDKSHQGAVM